MSAFNFCPHGVIPYVLNNVQVVDLVAYLTRSDIIL